MIGDRFEMVFRRRFNDLTMLLVRQRGKSTFIKSIQSSIGCSLGSTTKSFRTTRYPSRSPRDRHSRETDPKLRLRNLKQKSITGQSSIPLCFQLLAIKSDDADKSIRHLSQDLGRWLAWSEVRDAVSSARSIEYAGVPRVEEFIPINVLVRRDDRLSNEA